MSEDFKKSHFLTHLIDVLLYYIWRNHHTITINVFPKAGDKTMIGVTPHAKAKGYNIAETLFIVTTLEKKNWFIFI